MSEYFFRGLNKNTQHLLEARRLIIIQLLLQAHALFSFEATHTYGMLVREGKCSERPSHL